MDDVVALVPNRVRGYEVVDGVTVNAPFLNVSSRFAGGGLTSPGGHPDVPGAIAEREPGTSSGSEAGTVTLHFGADGAMDRATVELQRDLSIESEHGNVTVRQAVQGTLSRVP